MALGCEGEEILSEQTLPLTDKELQLIIAEAEKVKGAGFGEVHIIFKNKALHLIKSTEEKLVQKQQ